MTQQAPLPLPYIRVRDIGETGWRLADRKIARIRTRSDLKRYQARVRAATAEQLDALARAVTTAQTLDEALASLD